MRRRKLGATGWFPRGKLRLDDEGELQFSIGLKGDTVILDFGKSVRWIGMAAKLIESAELLEREGPKGDS